MDKDRKFGNIDLYLWQVRQTIAERMQKHGNLFFDEEVYVGISILRMLDFLLRRFSRRKENPVVTYDLLCQVLSDKGMQYQASSAWYNGRKISDVRFSGIQLLFTTSKSNTVVKVTFTALQLERELHVSKHHISGEDFLDCIFMVESLQDRISRMVHEEYAARIAKSKANRIRRIAAKHRRHMQ